MPPSPVPAHDRRRLERLCRYVARPPLASERLSRGLDDGRLLYRLKRRWRDGTTAIVFEPLELIEPRLTALVPPPRFHARGAGAGRPAARPPEADRAPRALRARRWRPLGELMRRVFAVDVLECPRCHGPMKILAAIHPPDTAGAILECLGLPARSPPVAPARRAAAPLFEPAPDWFRD